MHFSERENLTCHPITGQSRQMLMNYIEKIVTDEGEQKFKCTICGSCKTQKAHAENHVENIHFPGCFSYSCKFCGMDFDRRNQLYKHVKIVPIKQCNVCYYISLVFIIMSH